MIPVGSSWTMEADGSNSCHFLHGIDHCTSEFSIYKQQNNGHSSIARNSWFVSIATNNTSY